MKQSKFFEQWDKNVRVASAAEMGTQQHSPNDISLEDAALGWLAFKKLYNTGRVFINNAPNTHAAVSHFQDAFKGEQKGLMQRFKDRNKDPIAEWAAENPHNLLMVYRTGADIMKTGTVACVVLQRIHVELAEIKGIDVRSPMPDPEESKELFNTLFHRQEQAHAIALMEHTAEQRVQFVLALIHS